ERVVQDVAPDRDGLAVELRGPAGVIAEAVDDLANVDLRLADRLAVVEGLEARELLAARLDGIRDLPEQVPALGGGHPAPRPRECLARGPNRRIDLPGARFGDLGDDLTRRGVQRLERPTVRGVDPIAADVEPVRRLALDRSRRRRHLAPSVAGELGLALLDVRGQPL